MITTPIASLLPALSLISHGGPETQIVEMPYSLREKEPAPPSFSEPLPMLLQNRHARRVLEACAKKGKMPRKKPAHPPQCAPLAIKMVTTR